MYTVSKKKYASKKKLVDKTEILDVEGFLMASKRKVFKIEGSNIREIRVVDRKLANPLASKIIFQKYEKLIEVLTELLLEEDDDGETCQEILDRIEKFRMEIKNKYRNYLKKKELEEMSKKLIFFQKEAQKKLAEIGASYLEYQTSNNKNR